RATGPRSRSSWTRRPSSRSRCITSPTATGSASTSRPGRTRASCRTVLGYTGPVGGGAVLEYRGIHYGKDVQFTHWEGAPAAAQNAAAARAAQNNVVRMMRDPETGAYSHPVVYVEHGGHE